MAAPDSHPAAAGNGSQSAGAQTTSNKITQLFKRYGKVAVGVHLGVYAFCFTGCYLAVKGHVDVAGMLQRVGLMSAEEEDVPVEDQGWVRRALAGSSSSLALAFIANKALIPIRGPITIALTPPVARFLQRMRARPL